MRACVRLDDRACSGWFAVEQGLCPRRYFQHADFMPIVGVGKRGEELYWPRAGELSAVNAIGMQLRDPINSGLTRWRMAVING